MRPEPLSIREERVPPSGGTRSSHEAALSLFA